jgi:hypothetical protein
MTGLHWKSARLAAVIHPYLGNGICVGTALAGQYFRWPASFEAGHFLLLLRGTVIEKLCVGGGFAVEHGGRTSIIR